MGEFSIFHWLLIAAVVFAILGIRKLSTNKSRASNQKHVSPYLTVQSGQTVPTPESYRYPGEKDTFMWTAIALSFGVFVVAALTSGIALLIVIAGLLYIKLSQGGLKGSSIRVSASSFSRFARLMCVASERLGGTDTTLHVKQDPTMNAFAMGFPSASIFIHSGIVEHMDEAELQFVIGHELGHVVCGHTRWSSILGPLSEIPSPLLGLVFGAWQRRCEYSADRAGLIASQNLTAAVTALMKLSGGALATKETSITSFVQQANEADLSTQLGRLLQDHPYATDRVKELVAFANSPIYKRIVSAKTAGATVPCKSVSMTPSTSKATTPCEVITCKRCSTPLHPNAKFCHSCAAPIGLTRPLNGMQTPTPEKKCPECNMVIEGENAYCTNCGARVELQPATK